MPQDLDLRKLRYFVAVAEELNFQRAADRLHIAQPVLTRQIRALEHSLGALLFERSSRGTALTMTGEMLLDDARGLLRRAAAVQRRALQSARITIGFMPGVLVTPVIKELRVRFPGLVVEVVRTSWDDQVETVLDGRVDVGFVRMPVSGAGLRLVPLYAEPRVVALPVEHPLAAQDTVRMADLTGFELLQDARAVPEFHPRPSSPAAPRRSTTAPAASAAAPSPAASARAGSSRAVLSPAAPSRSDPGMPRRVTARTVEEKLEMVAGEQGIVILPESTAHYYTRADVTYRPVIDIGPNQVALAFEQGRESAVLAALEEIALYQHKLAS